jgi:hypothetical protein
MTSFQKIKEFQLLLQGRNFKSLRTAFGASFHQFFVILRKVLFVAKKLAFPYSTRVEKSLSKCFRALTEYYFPANHFDAAFFQQTLEGVDQELSQLFLEIVTEIIHHPRFSEYVKNSKKFFREEERQGLNPDRRSPYREIPIFVTCHVIDSFAAIAIQPRKMG